MGKGNGQPANTLCELPPYQDSRYALENRRNVLIRPAAGKDVCLIDTKVYMENLSVTSPENHAKAVVLLYAANMCEDYAFSLMVEKPEWAEVALECARMIDGQRMLVLANVKNGSVPCQALFNFLQKPEIDYQSGFPRK